VLLTQANRIPKTGAGVDRNFKNMLKKDFVL